MNIVMSKLKKMGVTPLIVFALMILVMGIIKRDFFSLQTVINLMQQVSGVGVVALGAMLVILTGGIDFTAGYGLAMIGMAAGTVYKIFFISDSVGILIITAVFCGLVLGLVNGLIIVKLNILPFIATLAIMSIAQGLSLMIGRGAMVVLTSAKVLWIGQGMLFGIIPVPFMIFIAVGFVCHIVLTQTKLGVYTYALGNNEEAVRLVGINVDLYKISIYVIAAILTAIASLLVITRIALVTPSIYGTTLLDAIAATVIGGTSLSGGKGNVFGTIVGVFIIVLIGTSLVYLNIPPAMQDAFKGILVLIAIGGDALINRRN